MATADVIPLPEADGVPAIHRVGMGYRGVWHRQRIVLNLTSLRADRGDPSGIVDVWVGEQHLCGALRLTLTAPQSRKGLAKDLGELSEYDGWGRVLDVFCREVVRLEATGEPFGWLAPWAGSTAVRYLVDPILRDQQPNTLFGPGGSWKSTLSTALALAVSTGYPLLGWTPRVGRVAVLDWETDRDDWAQRATMLARGFDLAYPVEMIAYRHCSGPLYRQTEQIAAWVAENEAALVILDSVVGASGTSREGGDPSDSTVRMFEAIRHIGSTWLLVDHVRGDDVSNERAGHSRPYGSIYKENLSRGTWELRREGKPDAVHQLVLSRQKANRGQPDLRFGIHGCWDEEGGRITLKRGEITAPDLHKHAHSLAERMADVLRAGPRKLRDLADEVGEGPDRVRMTAKRDGRFVQVDRATYALASGDR